MRFLRVPNAGNEFCYTLGLKLPEFVQLLGDFDSRFFGFSVGFDRLCFFDLLLDGIDFVDDFLDRVYFPDVFFNVGNFLRLPLQFLELRSLLAGGVEYRIEPTFAI